MRTFVCLVILGVLTAQHASAQLGVAARLEQGLPISLAMTVHVRGGEVMVEPFATVNRTSSDNQLRDTGGTESEDSEGSVLHLHLGAGIYLRSRGTPAFYLGPRVAMVRESRRFKSVGETGGTSYSLYEDGVLSGLLYGGLFGAEVPVARGISAGVEFTWMSESIEGDVDQSSAFGGSAVTRQFKATRANAGLAAAVVFRWFPRSGPAADAP